MADEVGSAMGGNLVLPRRDPRSPREVPMGQDRTRTRHGYPHRSDHMGLFDAFSYAGKRAVVVGGATGMGAATAELVKDAGAEVVVMDRAEVTLDGVKSIHLDLSDKAS